MARNYDAYITQAWNAGIPAELMNTVRPWVESHHTVKTYDEHDRAWFGVDSDLGYAELKDITSLEQAFEKIKNCIFMATLMETKAKTERAKKKYYKDAGGRVGKGVYRVALKGYYLSGQ